MNNFLSSFLSKITIGIALFGFLFWMSNSFFLNTQHKASLFSSSEYSVASDSIFYIPQFSAKRGETGEIAIKINKDITIQGFSFDLSYPSAYATANGISVESTALQGKNMLVQDNRNTAGHIKVAGVSGSNLSFKAGDTLMLISFSIHNSISENTTELPLQFENFSLINESGNESIAKTEVKKIALSSGASFHITKLVPSSKGTIEIEFSDILATDLILGCAEFSEQVLTNNAKLERNANKLTFSGLTLLPGKQYVVSFDTTVKSGQGISLNPAQQKIEFVVPNDGTTPDTSFDNTLGITSVVAKDLTTLDIIFSTIPSGDTFPVSSLIVKNNTHTLTLHTLVQNSADKKLFHLTTSAMTADTPYTLLIRPETWTNASGKKAGGTLSKIFWTSSLQAEASIIGISPYRPVQGVNTVLTITGNNLPSDAKITIGGVRLSNITLSNDKKTITATLPSTLPAGAYSVNVEYTINGSVKKITQENAVVVETKQETEIQVISAKSYASPLKVPNDNTTTTKLFVYVDDPRGLADLEKVTADLRVIHGNAAESLKPGVIENGQQVWFLENVKIPNTVQTRTEPYAIPVIAQNRAGLTGEGSVLLWVTKDNTSSVPPRIVNFTVTPSIITAGNKENSVLLFAEVSDEDSGEEITQVAVDLSSVGINTIFLTARNTGQYTGKTKFFENATPIVIPSETPSGDYIIKLKVIDAQGDEATLEKKITVTRQSGLGPSMTNEDTYVTPSKTLVKDGKSSFAIHTKVSDPSGSDNITSVSLNLAGIGLPPVVMNAGAKEGLSQWFSSSVLYIPDAASIGKKKLLITATDKQGNAYTQDLWVEITYQQDNGKPPSIDSLKNYITPTKAINDGKTPFSAYVFVKDIDDDISHVVLKMGNIALFNGTTLPKGTSSIDSKGEENCISTRTLLCMQPILKEAGGQWYYLSDIIVPPTTAARDTAYALEVNAFDKTGKMAEGKLNITVASSENITLNGQNAILYLQATSENTIQLVMKEPIAPKDFKPEWITISTAENANDLLSITGFTVSPDGRLITLQTANQKASKAYALKVDAEKMGVAFSDLSSTVFPLSGFFKPSKTTSFRATGIKAVSPTQFNISFSLPLNAKSMLISDGFEIFIEGQKEKLSIKGLNMADEKTLTITTSTQLAGQKYDVYYKGMESLYGEIITKKQTIKAEAYKQSIGGTVGGLQATADFNSDGIVDFKDFTLFAAVYGKTYSQASSGDLNGDSTVDFKDFTLFSSLYGEVLSAQSSPLASTSPNTGGTVLPNASVSSSPNASSSSSASPSAFPSTFVVSPSVAPSNGASPTPLPTFHYSASTPTPARSQYITPSATATPSSATATASPSNGTPTATPSPTATPCTGDPLVCLLGGN